MGTGRCIRKETVVRIARSMASYTSLNALMAQDIFRSSRNWVSASSVDYSTSARREEREEERDTSVYEVMNIVSYDLEWRRSGTMLSLNVPLVAGHPKNPDVQQLAYLKVNRP
jgi:hypothetical protein